MIYSKVGEDNHFIAESCHVNAHCSSKVCYAAKFLLILQYGELQYSSPLKLETTWVRDFSLLLIHFLVSNNQREPLTLNSPAVLSKHCSGHLSHCSPSRVTSHPIIQ